MHRIKVTNPKRPGAAYYATTGYVSCPAHATAYEDFGDACLTASDLRGYLAYADEVVVEKI